MIDKKVLSTVFDKHGIDKVTLLDSNNSCLFLVYSMSSNIDLNRWEHLENILKDITKKDVSILSYTYAKKHFDTDAEVVIKQ